MKILIVKLSSIGDVIHTLPVLSAIKQALPDAEISWVVEKGSAEILRNNPLISNLIEVDTKSLRKKETFRSALPTAGKQIRGLRGENYDVSLDFQGLVKSSTIAKLAKAKKRYGFSKETLREPVSRFLLTDTVDVPGNTHIIRKNLIFAQKALGIPVSDKNFSFTIFTEQKHRIEADEIVAQAGENFAILNPAGGWVTKLWSAERFGRLADEIWKRYGMISVVTTAPNEKSLAENVLKASKSGKIILSSPSLKGFYELAKQSKIYIGGDTGPTHLAIAAGAPIIGIFGPTEWWRNGSPNEDDICVERNDIGCRVDCHRRNCSNWICMDIDVRTVLNAVEARLKTVELIKTMELKKEVTIG